MKVPIEDILQTFHDYESDLKQLYIQHINQPKRNYRSKDLPDMIALDIVTDQQFKAMADLAESRLVNNLAEEDNSTDIIFDAILPEWAILVFSETYGLTRSEAVQIVRLQSRLVNMSESDLLNI